MRRYPHATPKEKQLLREISARKYVCTSELVQALTMKQPNVYKYLQRLLKQGWIKEDRSTYVLFYEITKKGLDMI